MTRDDIIRMAREAGFESLLASEHVDGIGGVYVGDYEIAEMLERFFHAAYAAGEQAERDRTKRLVEDMQNELYQRRMAGRT